MLLPRFRCGLFHLPCLLVIVIYFLSGEFANAQRYQNGPPRYRYDQLPKTAFTCQGKLPGRYYPDPETDCQMFHVCVKMNSRDVQDFRFLCPNGTVFDAEHQVCIDYYQVVCHEDVGTNPLGHIFEIYKISSGQRNPGLDVGKLSLVNPDSAERNTLGDDFHVEEYNNNRLASSQNSLSFRASSVAPPKKSSSKAKEDIFFNSKGFIPYTPSTTRRTTTTTSTEAPSSSTPRRPSLETFESYETESFSGFIPTKNSFGRGQGPTPDFDASTEDFATKDDDQYRTEISTTARPLIFQNTFRTTLSHVPSTSRPSAQTFQQQPTIFNDQFFTRIPTTTDRPVSKAAQFFRHTTTPDDYFTPEFRQPTANPFTRQKATTTFRPKVVFQGSSGTLKPSFQVNTELAYETTTATPITSSTTFEPPTTTEWFGKQSTPTDFELSQTTYNGDFGKNSNFFQNANANGKQRKEKFFETSTPRQLPPQLSSQYVEEESLKPRNIHGSSNPQNSLSKTSPAQVVTRPRDNFGFSTVPPPTTAESYSTFTPTASASTQQETAQTLAARLQSHKLFQKVTTKNPEKYSIFFGRSTPSVSDDRLPSPGPTTVLFYDSTTSTSRPLRVRSTTTTPFEAEHVSSASEAVFDRRGRLGRLNSAFTSTIAPEEATASTTSRPQRRRGGRRRLRPGRRQPGKNFDPELKLGPRRRFESARFKEGEKKTEEIFNAEASVFRGDPTLNNFFQDQKKGTTQTSDKVDQQTEGKSVSQFPSEQFFGRRVRPNGSGRGDAQQIRQDNDSNRNGSVPTNNITGGEGTVIPGPHRPEVRRRVVKRIRPKVTTTESGDVSSADNATSSKSFVVTGSTLRPVTRINVKTKLGGKITTTYRTTEITDASPSTTTRSTSTTTEPELITASDDEIAKKRNHFQHTSATTQKSTLGNESHLVIKVISDKPFAPSPLSVKKPILNRESKKVLKPSSGGVKKSSPTDKEEESQTRSPDYDYAYYNTDDASDYVVETGKLDHKNYGSKPSKGAQ